MKKEPGVIQYCPKCNEAYEFADFSMLDNVSLDTRCRKCGFYLFLYNKFKLDAVNIIISSNPELASTLLVNPEKLLRFLENEVGLKEMN